MKKIKRALRFKEKHNNIVISHNCFICNNNKKSDLVKYKLPIHVTSKRVIINELYYQCFDDCTDAIFN